MYPPSHSSHPHNPKHGSLIQTNEEYLLKQRRFLQKRKVTTYSYDVKRAAVSLNLIKSKDEGPPLKGARGNGYDHQMKTNNRGGGNQYPKVSAKVSLFWFKYCMVVDYYYLYAQLGKMVLDTRTSAIFNLCCFGRSRPFSFDSHDVLLCEGLMGLIKGGSSSLESNQGSLVNENKKVLQKRFHPSGVLNVSSSNTTSSNQNYIGDRLIKYQRVKRSRPVNVTSSTIGPSVTYGLTFPYNDTSATVAKRNNIPTPTDSFRWGRPSYVTTLPATKLLNSSPRLIISDGYPYIKSPAIQKGENDAIQPLILDSSLYINHTNLILPGPLADLPPKGSGNAKSRSAVFQKSAFPGSLRQYRLHMVKACFLVIVMVVISMSACRLIMRVFSRYVYDDRDDRS